MKDFFGLKKRREKKIKEMADAILADKELIKGFAESRAILDRALEKAKIEYLKKLELENARMKQTKEEEVQS